MKAALTTLDLQKYLDQKKKTMRIFAHFCSFTPEEVLHAAGILPVRIFGSNIIEKASAHLQSYCCSYAKRVLEAGLTNPFDGSVFVHSCDTMQRLSDIWGYSIDDGFHETLVLPVAVDKGIEYLTKELNRFTRGLEVYAGEISDTALKESISVYNDNRNLLQELYEKRKGGHILAVVVDKVMKASMSMLKQEHTVLLEEFLEEVELGEYSRPRLILSGSVVEDPSILEIIEEYGLICYDDLCTGSRYLSLAEEQSLRGIARRYQGMWCPCRTASAPRGQYLVEKAGEYDADGVILLLHKFCEPHLFEAVSIRNSLKEHGYPCLQLELEDQTSPEQVRTRIQAFCEMLEG
ncbi:MAG: 2-hydroxyacyl-CoA dehydratase [Theionarchaea archaeon]|nr:2-hydroxyacyl-CoA dehydratase [Theionarchaea archaeon]MBU7036845.1 2-hydroxyacyl-CoA dehydratase [Theionarchaea archaeon]